MRTDSVIGTVAREAADIAGEWGRGAMWVCGVPLIVGGAVAAIAVPVAMFGAGIVGGALLAATLATSHSLITTWMATKAAVTASAIAGGATGAVLVKPFARRAADLSHWVKHIGHKLQGRERSLDFGY